MPGQFHRRRYLYVEIHKEVFGHIGKDYYGLVVGRWPLLCAFRDLTFYYDVGTFGVMLGPWLEVGLFVDFRNEEQIRRDMKARPRAWMNWRG